METPSQMTPIERCLADSAPALLWINAIAAEIEGKSINALRSDAGTLTQALSTAATLFDLPAITTTFDSTLEISAIGNETSSDGLSEGIVTTIDDALAVPTDAIAEQGRIPAHLEATDRLVGTLDDTSVLGGITGPSHLRTSLLRPGVDDEAVIEETTYLASDIAVALTNAFLSRDADGITLVEPDGIGDPDRFIDATRPILNVVDHFDATTILAQNRVQPSTVATAGMAGFDAVTGLVPEFEPTLAAADRHQITLGVGIPDHRFVDDAVDDFFANIPGDPLLSSQLTIPKQTSPETIHRLMGSLTRE